MTRRVLFTIALITAGIGSGKAQQIRQCATMEQDSINRLRYPQRDNFDDLEQAIQAKMKEFQRQIPNGRPNAELISIPIIVHVIHKGEAVGTGMNLSQAQIQSQLAVLNEDFRRKAGTNGFNTSPVGADIEIEFCLSPVDEQGNLLPEPGIHRYNGGQDTWTRAQIDNSLKPTTIWNSAKFFNVWTLKFGGEDANLLGYAQFPDQSGLSGLNEVGGSDKTDGVVIQYTSFGSAQKGSFPIMSPPYNKGRTLTHETGHWLGLRHIWGDGNCATDFVDDTPTAQGPNRGCPSTKLSCDNVNLLMPQNYMDYTDDDCMNIFTQGQKTRIRAVLAVSPRRKSLYAQGSLCSPPNVTDPPVVSFIADKKNCVLSGSEVRFTDLSTNFPTQYYWKFEGGDPATSTEANPKIRYNVAGVYKVWHSAKNKIGWADTLMVADYITVSSEGLCSSFSNFKPEHTPSVLNAADFGPYTGYLAGTNSTKAKAYSELFNNTCGYKYISGVKIKFGHLESTNENATINVTVWNALGYQGGPGAVLERKELLLKQVQDDIANNRFTEVTLDRETPAAFGRPFHVGIEIVNDAGYKLAIVSSANNEATNSTSWVQDATGEWHQMTIAFGANVALNIVPIVGANPSVQVSSSRLLIEPGEQVILNGRGASIFSWSSSDNTINDVLGPQLTVNPVRTTTYTVTGAGLELCHPNATATIYVSGTPTPTERADLNAAIQLHPNPGTTRLNLTIANDYVGQVTLQTQSLLGQDVMAPQALVKNTPTLSTSIDTSLWPAGLYLINVRMGSQGVLKKWIKK